jgi:hypothetical protein
VRYDRRSKAWQDIELWWAEGFPTADPPSWSKQASVRSLLGMRGLTPEDWEAAGQAIATNQTALDAYMRGYWKGRPPRAYRVEEDGPAVACRALSGTPAEAERCEGLGGGAGAPDVDRLDRMMLEVAEATLGQAESRLLGGLAASML